MSQTTPSTSSTTSRYCAGIGGWRLGLVGFLVVAPAVLLWAKAPIVQPESYHDFADRRAALGVRHAGDVLSNLAFIAVGLYGIFIAWRCTTAIRLAWVCLFAGVTLVSIGSAYYHWAPTSDALVWDRLPMTIGFMGLFTAVVGEYISETWGRRLLVPMVLLGLSSVVYWDVSGDLSLYVWVQFTPLLMIAVLPLTLKSAYTHSWCLVAALSAYVLAKFVEHADTAIFSLTRHLVSGHTLKHLFAAVGVYFIAYMLSRRTIKAEKEPARH